MRIFLAVEIPNRIKEGLVRIQRDLESRIPDVRWEKPEKVHITLVFLGDLPAGRQGLEKVVRGGLKGLKGFKVELSGISVFPNERRPRVVLVEVGEGAEEFRRLQRSLEEELSAAGFNFKPGKKPHVTLGRFQRGVKEIEDIKGVKDMEGVGSFRVKEVTIVESRLRPQGAVHTSIARIPLC